MQRYHLLYTFRDKRKIQKILKQIYMKNTVDCTDLQKIAKYIDVKQKTSLPIVTSHPLVLREDRTKSTYSWTTPINAF